MQKTILIIDDSYIDRTIMGTILKRNIEGVRIIYLSDGLNAVETIITKEVHVCILDLMMPDRDGFTVLEDIKGNPQTADVPVIVCSGMIDTHVLERVLSMGAYDYFAKPLSEEVMKVALPLKVRNAIDLAYRTQYMMHLSRIDALTGLFNRAYFKSHYQNLNPHEFDKVTLAMVDINGLKVVNDAYGSEAGDHFLLHAAQVISKYLPQSAVAARWGGDEFVIMLPNMERLEVDRFIKSLKEEFSVFSYSGLTLSLASGYDTWNTGIDLSRMIVNAEDSLFRDKVLEDVSVRSTMLGTILNTLHEKNPREEAHSRRVSELCEQMGLAMELHEKEVQSLRIMGLVHDIGKIAIDEHILNKPGRLTHEEWLEMRRHPEIGYRLLSSAPEMKEFADAILHHHERVDGKGYPSGVTGENIPEHARILTIIDAYDAMTCERTYKISMSKVDAARELLRCVNTQFDQGLTHCFIKRVLNLNLEDVVDDASLHEQS